MALIQKQQIPQAHDIDKHDIYGMGVVDNIHV